MAVDPSSFSNLPVAVWIAFGVGLLFGTGAIWHRLGLTIFSRLFFPVAIVFGLATIATYIELPGVDFDLATYLPSLRGQETMLAKALFAGFGLAFVLRVLWRHMLISQGKKGRRDTHHWRSARSVYYETAIRLGVLTANADRNAEPREFAALEEGFDLNMFNAPNARKLYAEQLETPRPMSRVLAAFLKRFDRASAACETLILGMATIAMADGRPTDDELGLVRMAASRLGLTPADANRLLDAAGGGAEAPDKQRAAHLATLGLDAGATSKQISKAYKRLIAKHAPNRLLLLGMPDAERSRIDVLKAQLDTAFAALSDAP